MVFFSKFIFDVACQISVIIASYCTYSQLIDLVKEIDDFQHVMKKYGKLFCIENMEILISLFSGVYSINLENCTLLTDIGVQALKVIHTINLSQCDQLTDCVLKFFKGIHKIDLSFLLPIKRQWFKIFNRSSYN